MKLPDKLSSFLIIFTCLTILLLGWLPRILLGVDFTDEAFPLAVAKHLSFGAKLFADEIDIHQTTAPYLYPFYRIFSFFVPTLEGLFVFMRMVPLIGMAVICWFFFRRTLNSLGLLKSFALVSPLLLYAPGPANGTIYSIGAYLAWTAFLLLNVSNFRQKYLRDLFGLGIFAGVLTGFYITPICLFSFAGLILIVRRQISIIQFWCVFAGYLLGLLPVFYFLPETSLLSHLFDVIHTNTQLHYPFFTKEKFDRFIFNSQPHWWSFSLFFAGYFLNRRPLRNFHHLIMPVVTLTIAFFFCTHGEPMNFQSDRIALATWLLIAGAGFGDETIRCRVGLANWVWAFALGAITSYTTNARGILTFAWVLAPLGILILAEMANRSRTILATAVILSSGLWISHALYNYDSAIDPKLKAVTSGPYKYLWTHSNKVAYLESISNSLAQIPNDSKILIYYNFPTGYLISGAAPASNFLWAFFDFHDMAEMNSKITNYHLGQLRTPGYAVEIKYILGKRSPISPYVVTPSEKNEIRQMVQGKYVLVEETEILRLFRLTGDPQQ